MNTEDSNSSKFEKVYEKYKIKVFQAAMSFGENDYHLAQEVVQEVFAKCFVYKIYLEEDAKIVKWLKIVTRNYCINLSKVRKREKVVDLVTQKEDKEVCEIINTKGQRDEEIFVAKQKVYYILDALYNKNRIWYDCILMHYLLGMKDDDIAIRMNMTVGAVKMVLKRAKEWAKESCSKIKDT